MKIINTCKAEILKLRGEKIVWITFLAFGIAPLMGGFFILILNDPVAIKEASALATKADIIGFKSNWQSYIQFLSYAMAVGGILIFGFVISWTFGREYSDGAAKDLMSLPVPRITILQAKFIICFLWCSALAISNVFICALVGTLAGLEINNINELNHPLWIYLSTTLITISVSTPIAMLALIGKGYLAPLGFTVMLLVLSQVIAASGFGHYFPWSIPALHSGLGGNPSLVSYILITIVAILGYLGTLKIWSENF